MGRRAIEQLRASRRIQRLLLHLPIQKEEFPSPTPAKLKKKTPVDQQVREEEGTWITTRVGPGSYESNSEGEDDPRVNGIVIPMMARVEIVVPSLGARGIIDTIAGLGVHLVYRQPPEGLGLRKLK